MGTRKGRFYNRLNNRLFLTHMLVAAAVLAVALILLLLAQAPIRNDLLERRLGEALDPGMLLTSAGISDALIAGAPLNEIQQQLWNVVQNQVSGQNIRILLVNSHSAAILYDSGQVLAGKTWQPTSATAFEPRRAPMGRPMMQHRETAAVRGAADVSGEDWVYVATMVPSATQADPVLLVLTRQRLSVAQTLQQILEETPIGLLLLILAALLLVIFFLSRWSAMAVSKSLAPLSTATEQIAAGNYAYRVPDDAAAIVEVQNVAESFNQMADRVQQTQQAQRDFIANVSHDLKTPLTSIQGYSQALLDGTAASPVAQRHAALVIAQESDRLGKLVEEVIDAARIDSGKLELHLEPVDINWLMQEMVDSVAARAQAAAIRVNWNPSAETLRAMADAHRLRRAVGNLLDNALRYTPAGGSVTVSTASATADGRRWVVVAVADTGAGIAPEDRSRIFERFYRGDKARTGGAGSGLGLSIVQEIVEAHGGGVSVDSIVGQGSRFTIRLPMAEIGS